MALSFDLDSIKVSEGFVDSERAITADAMALAAAISSASPNDLENLKKAVMDLQTRAVRLHVNVPALAALDGAIATKEASVEVDATSAAMTTAAQSQTIIHPSHQRAFQQLTKLEKEFFDSIKSGKEYLAYTMDKDGNVTETSVKGEDVKSSFLELKKHALNDKTRDEESPDKTIEEMKKLKEALDTSESYHLGKLVRSGQAGKIHAHHERFAEAHKHADEVIHEAEECKKCHGNEAKRLGHKFRLRNAREDLGNHLQEDIIDGTMVHDREHAAPSKNNQRGYEVADMGGWKADTEFRAGNPGGKQRQTGQSTQIS